MVNRADGDGDENGNGDGNARTYRTGTQVMRTMIC